MLKWNGKAVLINLDAATEFIRLYLEELDFLDRQLLCRSSVWDEINAIVEQVPEQSWNELPTDGAEQHDHYLYRMTKENP
ncbi:MAG: hypothetical protein SW833_17470 [Cyanobacteriota bacterium]|nr:hypothetical protein [Cyanobacteriota bacterium]